MAEGKKSAKAGRNQTRCARYRAEARQEVNQLLRLRRRLRTHPKDKVAVAAAAVLAPYAAQAEREAKAARGGLPGGAGRQGQVRHQPGVVTGRHNVWPDGHAAPAAQRRS